MDDSGTPAAADLPEVLGSGPDIHVAQPGRSRRPALVIELDPTGAAAGRGVGEP